MLQHLDFFELFRRVFFRGFPIRQAWLVLPALGFLQTECWQTPASHNLDTPEPFYLSVPVFGITWRVRDRTDMDFLKMRAILRATKPHTHPTNGSRNNLTLL